MTTHELFVKNLCTMSATYNLLSMAHQLNVFPATDEAELRLFNTAVEKLSAQLFDIASKDETYAMAGHSGMDEEGELNACKTFFMENYMPCLSILRVIPAIDADKVVSIAPEGERCTHLHVVTTVPVIKEKIITRCNVMEIADSDNPHHSMDWLQLVKFIKQQKEEEVVLTTAANALAWEIHSITKK